jgi:hypothetical protein
LQQRLQTPEGVDVERHPLGHELTIGKGTPMIEHTLDRANAILYVRPISALEKADFEQLAKSVDPYLEGVGDLAGLVIEAPTFPGWDTFGALVEHIRFVRNHQKHVKKVALVTDSKLGDVAQRLASHFISAEVRHFPSAQVDAARQWVLAR